MFRKLGRQRSAGPSARQVIGPATELIDQANAARDRRDFATAALLYARAAELRPENGPLHVQCGHMFKEARAFEAAWKHYQIAQRLMPSDADLALQIGHFQKVVGHLGDARDAYERAAKLAPNWQEPRKELAWLDRLGFRGKPTGGVARAVTPSSTVGIPHTALAPGYADAVAQGGISEVLPSLAPELAPREPTDLLREHGETIELRHFGRPERTRWGTLKTVRGVEAIRGFCISALPVTEVQLKVNGTPVHLERPGEGVAVKGEKTNFSLRKYVFNIWFDFSQFADGRYDIELTCMDAEQRTRSHKENIVVAAPLDPALFPYSDGLVAATPGDPRPLEDQINSLPSVIRPAGRRDFDTPPRNVLVLRLDQLGDMVCSVPALRRLREILPTSRLIGLISPTNRDLAVSLSLFDEILVADFAEDATERRRLMPLAEQVKLRATLAEYRFDLAIDLSDGHESRPLLLLSGAPVIYGTQTSEFPWLSAEFAGKTHDPANRHDWVSHTSKMMGLVEWLGVLMKSHSKVECRSDLPRSILGELGISEDDRFIVLHQGARLAFARWPYYGQLAARIIERTGFKVVVITNDADFIAGLPEQVTQSDRVTVIDRMLPFDVFDALVSYCAVFVGNDSGPRQLATLRGAQVVAIHTGRQNWSEWGQENSGYIISRKTPCSGCHLHHFQGECGKGFVCIRNITVDEVYGAVEKLMGEHTPSAKPLAVAAVGGA